jgi:hypothetical protein
MRHWLLTRLPHAAVTTGAVASAVHGLGLLTAMTMAATGAIVYAAMSDDGSLAAPWESALAVHRLVASLSQVQCGPI